MFKRKILLTINMQVNITKKSIKVKQLLYPNVIVLFFLNEHKRREGKIK